MLLKVPNDHVTVVVVDGSGSVINCDVHFKMFRYNPKANYQPNGGRYLQMLSGKDLYKQTIVISAVTHNDTFPVRFPNIFVDYSLGQMLVGDKLWTNWNKAPLKYGKHS